MTLDEPKAEIYAILQEVAVAGLEIEVYQERPEVIESFPCMTFRISNNVPQYDLDKSIGKQDIIVIIDIWAETSVDSGKVLVALESKMKEYNYLLAFNGDVPDPEGNSHITTQFTF